MEKDGVDMECQWNVNVHHYISLYITLYARRATAPHFVRSAVAEFHCSTKAPREDAAGGVAMKMGMGLVGVEVVHPKLWVSMGISHETMGISIVKLGYIP